MIETVECRAGAFGTNIDLCKADHPAWLADALGLLQQFGPLPGADPALGETHVHQIKKAGWKFEHAQGIHDHKLDPVTHLVSLGLSACIVQHFAADVDAE